MAYSDDLEKNLAAAADNNIHCIAPFWPKISAPTATSAKLDYQVSDGRWFERLCFRLGWRHGYTMRYFGRQGQEQYGVDLVGTRPDGSMAVWQCKNIGVPPRAKDIADWIGHFCQKWLGEKSLAAPTHFFLCWPHPFADTVLDEEWQKQARQLKHSWGIVLEPWHRDALDEKLRASPDIVADLFGDANAEAFLGPDVWPATSPFDPLPFSDVYSYPPRLRRYREAVESDRLYEDAERQNALAELMAEQRIALVRGAPGSGKTFDVLSYCRQQANEGWRTYYLNLADIDNSFNDVQLAEGIRRRLSLPTQFVIDDCHGREASLGKILRLLSNCRQDDHLRLLCLSRYVPLDPTKEREGQQQWFTGFEEEGIVLDMKVDDAFLKNYVEQLRPDYEGLSAARRQRLHALTGRNLLLLDIYLSSGEPAEFLDGSDRRSFFRTFRDRALGNNTRHARGLRRLAALAQFELTPPPEWAGDDSHALEMSAPGFLVHAGWPRRTHFVHSSAAELVFHGLAQTNNSSEELGQLLREYLLGRVRAAGTAPAARAECLEEASLLLRARPVLLSSESMAAAHSLWLSDIDIATALVEASASVGGHDVIRLALLLLAEGNNASARVTFANALGTWLRRYLTIAEDMTPTKADLFYLGSSALRGCTPSLWHELEEEIPIDHWLGAIAARSALREFLHLLIVASQAFAGRLLAAMSDDYLPRLIAKTISSGRSTGTIHVALRELGKNAPALRDTLEARLDPAAWLKLIAANDTISELCMLFAQFSPSFAGRLLAAMPEDYVPRLIAKTRSSGRSIGILSLALWELRKNAPTVHNALEDRFDPATLLELIAINGTISELFKLFGQFSPSFAGRLLAAMPEDYLPRLIANTLSSGRSIGTVHMALRELGKNAPALRDTLEARFNPAAWLELIAANGTIFELFKFLEHISPAFAEQLLAAMPGDYIPRLIAKTRSSGRSIGTLNLALREVGKNAPALRAALEARFDPAAWLELIAANGTAFELFMILRYTSRAFAGRLLATMTKDYLPRLIAKTRSSGRSIGTLNLTLNALRRAAPDLRRLLESRMGAEGFAILLLGNGTLGTLADLGDAFSDEFRPTVLAACAKIPRTDWQGIVTRSHFFELAELLVRSRSWSSGLGAAGAQIGAVLDEAEALATRASWYSLHSGQRQAIKAQDAPWQSYLLKAVDGRVASTEVSDLPPADDWAELANAADLLFDSRVDLRSALTGRLEEAFCRLSIGEGESVARWIAQLVFQLRRGEFSKEVVARCLNLAMAPAAISTLLRDGDSLQRFLWLWNCFAVHWERLTPNYSPKDAGKAFRQRWQAQVSDQLFATWQNDAERMRNFIDTAHVLMQAGLLSLLGLNLPHHDSLSWPALQKARFSLSMTLKNPQFGFVPTYFLQYGALAILNDREAFSPDRQTILSKKLALYDNPTLPILALFNAMSATKGRPPHGASDELQTC